METMTTHENTDWLTRQEAADRAGVTVRTIDNWVLNGVLTKHLGGIRRVRIDAAELDAFLAPRIAGADRAASA